MADKDIVATIRKRDSERAGRLVDIIDEGVPGVEGTTGEIVAAGLDFLVKDYRETAELWLSAKARGGKAQSDDRKTVAAALALLAVELRKPANKVTAETYRQALAPRPEKRCGGREQHEAHSWTEWVGDTLTEGGQVGTTYGCPGWSTPPRDLSGLKALVDERVRAESVGVGTFKDIGGGVIANTEPITIRAEDLPVTVPAGMHFIEVPALAEAMQQQPFSFTFDEPSPPPPETVESAPVVFDEPPPPGQAVALGGEVYTWTKLREVRESFRRGPEGAAEFYGLPGHVSHSQIGTFSECALKGLLTRSETLGVQQLPQWANVGGTAVHLAVERFERMVHEVRQLQYVKDRLRVAGGTATWWNEAFRDTVAEVAKEHPHAPVETWRASKQGCEGYTWWLVEGEAMFQRYVTARLVELESPWRKVQEWAPGREIGEPEPEPEPRVAPMLEHEFVMDVEGTPFRGVIDQVWKVTAETVAGGPAAGDLLIDDMKSGSTPNDVSQLREYALWLASTGAGGGTARIWGRFIDVRQGEIASAPFILLIDPTAPGATKDAYDELAFKVEHTAGLKASGSFMPRKNNYCVACPVKHACPIMAALPWVRK